MPIDEVFPNPTVKNVIFQIRFPNLFYLENRIGELQLKIMREFPESSLIVRKRFVVADVGPQMSAQDFAQQIGQEVGPKVWQFKSPRGYELNVLTDSLDITSSYHKTYDRPEAESRFRDVIKLVLDAFFGICQVPFVSRVGLRYINECPVPSTDSSVFSNYYATAFPLDRFPLEQSTEMVCRVVVKRGQYSLGYLEALVAKGDNYVLTLDLDAFSEKVTPDDCLTTVDKLHNLIDEEFSNTIKEPVLEYMRTATGHQETN